MVRRLLATVACSVAATVIVSPVVAASATAGSGTFATTSSTLVSTQSIGKATLYTFAQDVTWTGPINGNAKETLYVLVFPSAPSLFWGTDVCACTSPSGAPGTLTLGFAGTDNGTTFHGRLRIIEAHGGLAGFRGHATLQGVDASLSYGTYTGSFFQRPGEG